MEFGNIKFRKGIRGSDEILNEEKKHLAFYGRSNVGKSSSINSLLGRKKLVKSSATPGKTKEINFFEVEVKKGGGEAAAPKNFFFIDLPGYGYAKISKKEREKIRKLILWYILYSEVKNRLNILVVDARRGLGDFELEMLEIFKEKKEDCIILINKIDKLNQKEKNKLEEKLKNQNIKYFLFSAKTGKGKEKILQEIFH